MAVENRTKRKLSAGEQVTGAWLLTGSTRAAEVLSRTPVDWVGIDAEHAPRSPARIEALVRAVERDATPLVRLPSVEAAATGGAKRALDSGARGIVVPNVETPDESERVVSAAHFPPTGDRGVAGTTRANRYGEDFEDHVTRANEETLVVVQLESPRAVDSADEILAVDGVDVAFVGENDLSAAYGYPGEADHPAVESAVQRVLQAARANDVCPGIAGRTRTARTERAERGFRFFLLGADLTFMRRDVARLLAG